MRKALKIVAVLIGVLVLIVLTVVIYLNVKGIPHYEAKDPGIIVPPDSAMIVQGKKLAVLLCKDCHYNPVTDKLSGKRIDDPAVAQFGKLWSQNITQDKEFGIGNWTDGQLMYLFRTSIRPDGRYLPPWMPSMSNMSDYDVKSIIAFLHSPDPWVQASATPDTAVKPSLLSKFLANTVFKPRPYPDHEIAQPDTNNKVAWGRYIVTGALDCYPCHSADFKTMRVDTPWRTPGFMGGGNQVGMNANGEIMLSANITPDKETGIGNWSEAEFIRALRFGQKPDGSPIQMPMVPFSALTESEARAVYQYLMTIPPISNKITNPKP